MKRRYYFFFFGGCAAAAPHSSRGICWKKKRLVSAFCLIRVRNQSRLVWSGRTAALSHSRFLLATLVLKQREVPATVSSFYVSVLHTAMLRMSIAAADVGCFYFCPLDCDASADWKNIKVAHLLRVLQVQQHGIYTYLIRTQNFFCILRLMRYTDVCFFSLSGVLFPRE